MRNHEIRHEVLLQLYGSRLPLRIAFIHQTCGGRRLDYAHAEIVNELIFLVDAGFAKIVSNPATGEVRYQITSPGVLHWENVEGD